jgi:hypothetical protein
MVRPAASVREKEPARRPRAGRMGQRSRGGSNPDGANGNPGQRYRRRPAHEAGVLVIRSLTIPGRPEHVRAARAFVTKALGQRNPLAEVAVLLTSELVTNAIMHSDSSYADGVVTLLVEMRGACGSRWPTAAPP